MHNLPAQSVRFEPVGAKSPVSQNAFFIASDRNELTPGGALGVSIKLLSAQKKISKKVLDLIFMRDGVNVTSQKYNVCP